MGNKLIDGYLLVGPLEEPKETSLRTSKKIGACLLSLKGPLKGHSLNRWSLYHQSNGERVIDDGKPSLSAVT
jgi:hypothetical protein